MRRAYRVCAALALAASTLACGFPVDDSKYEVDDRTPFVRIVEAFAQDSQSCETCLSNTCVASITECEATAGCTEFAECVREKANPAGQASCLSKMVDVTFAANIAYTGVADCWKGCTSQCAVGTSWDCLDGYSVTQPPSAIANVQQSFKYLCGNRAVQGARVTYCDTEQHCGDPEITDDSGTYSIDIPINMKPSLAGWRGYRRVEGEGLAAPHRLEQNLPILSDQVESTQLLSFECALEAVSDLRAIDDSAAWWSAVAVQVFDCNTSGAEGVVLEVESAPNASIQYTANDGTDDVVYVPESSTASGEGLALVADLPDGVHEIVARETKSGRVVGKATVKVPTDDIILYNVLPAPGGQ